MSKLRKTILIVGILIVAVAASLGTALALYATGSMKTDPVELVYMLRDSEKVYDGTPLKLDDPLNDITLKNGKLSAGHSAKIEFIGSQTNVGTSESDATVKIYDENGFNVTGDYTIKVVGAQLTVHKKSISVELPAQSVVYDGSRVLFNQYKISENSEGDLCSGHRIYGSTDAALMNVGDTLPEDLTPLIFDIAGNDVTENYDIADFIIQDREEIKVIPRPVTVRPVSYEKVYDGKAVYADDIELVEGTFVEGQTYEVEINEGYTDFLTDVGEIETAVTKLRVYAAIDGGEVEVTDNYEFIFEEGYLKVTPRTLTVTAKSATFEYNGDAQSLEGDTEALTVEGLAGADEFVGVTYFGSRTDVGVTENVIAEVNLKGLAANYDILRVNGTIEITPREMVFKTASAEKYYDGEPLVAEGRDYRLVNDRQIIEINGDGQLPSITNAGEISNAYTVSIVDGEGDCTHNYDIKYEYGTLKVKILPVKVTLKNSEDEREQVNFDGTVHSPTLANADYFEVGPVLPDGEEVNFNLGYTDFEVVAETRAMCNAGEYYYTVKFRDKQQEERQRYANYELYVPESGILEVTPLPVSVALKEYADKDEIKNAFTYSGNAVKIKAEDAITAIALGEGATLSAGVEFEKLITKEQFIVVADEIIDAGTDYYYTVKIAESDVAKNFEVKIAGLGADDKGVKVEVNPMPVVVTLADLEREYDGLKQAVSVDETVKEIKKKETGAEGEDVNELAGLTKNDLEVTFRSEDDPINAADYAFVVTAIKKKAQSNYEFTYKNGAGTDIKSALLKINPKKVTVTINDATMVYGDTAMPENTFALDCGELPNGETLTFTTRYENADGEEVEPEIRFGHVLLAAGGYKKVPNDDKAITGGNKKIENYDFNFGTGGKLTVKPRPVTITTGDAEKVYDGTALRRKAASSDIALFADHTIIYPADDKISSRINVGEEPNAFEVDIMSGGNSVKSNYLITNVWGTLKVTARAITVSTGGGTKSYDGTPLYNTNANIETALSGAMSGYRARIAAGAKRFEIINADSVKNKFDCEIIANGGVNVTENFTINYDYGTLTIEPVAATFSLNDFSEDINDLMTYDGKQKEFAVKDAVNQIKIGAATYGVDKEREEGAGIAFAESDFVIEYSAPLIGFGKYTYTVRFADENFRKNFVIADEESQLTCTVRVKKKQILIEVKSYTGEDSFTYDNKVKTLNKSEAVLGILDDNFEAVDVNLLSADDLFIICSEELLNAGNYIYKVKIEDDDLAKNFLYTEPEGEVTIGQFAVNVSLADYKATYSGDAFEIPANSARIESGEDATDEQLALEAILTPADFAYAEIDGKSITDCGKYEYAAYLTDETKARNFSLNIVGETNRNATVEIEKCIATVTLNELKLTFNREEQKIDGKRALVINTPLLTADDFEYNVKKDGETATLKTAGEYAYEVKLLNSNFELTDHEDGVVTGGKITMAKYKEKVTLNNLSKVYDGEEYDLTPQKTVVVIDGKEYDTIKSPIESVEGELFSEDDFVIVYADVTKENPEPDHTNAAEYVVKARLGKTLDQFNDSVDIETVNGTVTITPKTITIITHSKSFEYTGEAQSAPEAELVGAVEGHFAEAVKADGVKPVSVTNVAEGEVVNKSVYKIYRKVVNGDGSEGKTEVTGNYVIDEKNSVYGTLRITPKTINVNLKEDINTTYRGQNGNISITNNSVIDTVESDKFGINDFAVVFDGEVVNAGEYPFEIVLKDADIAANYAINPVGANVLTVTKLVLNVKLENYATEKVDGEIFDGTAKEYTGKKQEVPKNSVSELDDSIENNPDAIGKTGFTFTSDKEMLEAGVYYYDAEIADENLRGNYTLQYTKGVYEIIPAKITVKLQNYVKTYNGTTYTVDLMQAITGIKNSAGNESELLQKTDFRIIYNQQLRLANNYLEVLRDGEDYEGDIYTDDVTGVTYKVLTDRVYNYGAELTDTAKRDNFDIRIEGGEFRINKRLLTFTATNIYMSKKDYGEGGYADSWEIEVKDYVSISPNTPLADGDQLKIVSATAEKEFMDSTAFKLYALDYELTNAGCYEFTNVNGDVNSCVTVQLITY